MDPIKINHLKQNTIEFELEVEGDKVEGEEYHVRFVVETHGVDLSFPCNVNGKKCVANIPVLDFMDKTTFNFRVEVIVDGYFFEASKGVVTVVGSNEIYTTQPKVKLSTTTGKTNSADRTGGVAKASQDRMKKKEESSPSTDNAKKMKKVKETGLLKQLAGTEPTSAEKLAETILAEGGIDEPNLTPPSNTDSKVREILANIEGIRKNPGATIRKGAVVSR